MSLWTMVRGLFRGLEGWAGECDVRKIEHELSYRAWQVLGVDRAPCLVGV